MSEDIPEDELVPHVPDVLPYRFIKAVRDAFGDRRNPVSPGDADLVRMIAEEYDRSYPPNAAGLGGTFLLAMEVAKIAAAIGTTAWPDDPEWLDRLIEATGDLPEE